MQSESAQRFKHTRSFSRLAAPHKIVHDTMLNNIDFVEKGTTFDGKNPDTIVENFTKMETATQELFGVLDDMAVE